MHCLLISCTQILGAITPSDGPNVKVLGFALVPPKSEWYSHRTNSICTSRRFEGSPQRLLVGLLKVCETCFLCQIAFCPSEVDIVYVEDSLEGFTAKSLTL